MKLKEAPKSFKQEKAKYSSNVEINWKGLRGEAKVFGESLNEFSSFRLNFIFILENSLLVKVEIDLVTNFK